MTNEQREAIDTLKGITENDLLNYWEGTERPYNAIQIALSLIKEQQEEIGSLQKDINEENKRCMILANNDKFKEQVIDLMALAIINYDGQLVINRYKNIDDVKQYFANLVEKE